jgi:hypothetical protein
MVQISSICYFKFLFKHLEQIFVFEVLLWIRIRIGSGFNDLVDPDPDWAKMLDPDP